MASPDGSLLIRRMRPDEYQAVLDTFNDVGVFWNFVKFSAEINDPEQSLLLLGMFDGRHIANVVLTRTTSGVYYISALSVQEEYRGRGFGSRLLDEALKYVKGCAVLDTGNGILLESCLRRSFVTSHTVVTMRGKLKLPQREPTGVSQFDISQFDELMKYDDKVFIRPGCQYRRQCLQIYLNQPGAVVMVARDQNQKIIGYGCCMSAYQEFWRVIHLFYADTQSIAEELLLALGKCLSSSEQVSVNCRSRSEVTDLYTKFGLEHGGTSTRLCVGTFPEVNYDGAYAFALGLHGF